VWHKGSGSSRSDFDTVLELTGARSWYGPTSGEKRAKPGASNLAGCVELTLGLVTGSGCSLAAPGYGSGHGTEV